MTAALPRAALLFALLLIAALVLWLPNALVTPTVSLLDLRARHDPDHIIENFTATAMDEQGRPKYVLVARRLVHYPDDLTSHLTEPHLTQYRPGAAPVHTRAATGLITPDQKYLLMQGEVRVTQGAAAGAAGGEVRTRELRVYLE
jgi:lipopolysaccharide export system protein LptC